jgi:hypothetical protein
MNYLSRYEGSVSLSDEDLFLRSRSEADIPQKSSKPLYFYNRKHKVKRASKMDLGLLEGELISVAPGAVPLADNQCSVSGGSSGLFSAFEPIGLTGSKEEGSLMASAIEADTVLGSPSCQDLGSFFSGKGSSAAGLSQASSLWRGSRRSPLPVSLSEAGECSERGNLLEDVFALPWNISEVESEDVGAKGYSEGVVSAMAIAPILGMSFGGDEKRVMDLLSDIEEGQHREGVVEEYGSSVLKPKGWRERKNLECSLNFDVGDIGSSRSKNRACLRV